MYDNNWKNDSKSGGNNQSSLFFYDCNDASQKAERYLLSECAGEIKEQRPIGAVMVIHKEFF